ncbi:MAG: ABC transporter permease, partial [Bryobacteraceae bacterium]
MLTDLVYRLRALFRRSTVEAEMNDELRFHFEQEVNKYEQSGLPRDEALRRARLAFGEMEHAKEECREARGVWFVETAIQDLLHALRLLRRSPGFTIATIAALALGIGANTAIFSVIHTVLLKPLTYPDPGRIVQFVLGGSVPKFKLWREQTTVFQDVSAYDSGGAGINLTGGAFPQQVRGIHVTTDYFRLFGASIERGRTFTAKEEEPHGPHVVVLSDSLWRQRYGANPHIVGRNIDLGGAPYEVIGVIGSSFHSDPAPDLWIPFQFEMNTRDPST